MRVPLARAAYMSFIAGSESQRLTLYNIRAHIAPEAA